MIPKILDLLTEYASRALAQADQEALRGDLAESGVSGLASLRDVMSLVIRQRLADLRDFSPWIALLFLAVPLGLLLSLVSRWTADSSAIYLWAYANNWSFDLARLPGFRRELAACLPGMFFPCFALACSSWTAGLLVGSYARRTLWFSGGTLIAVLLCVGILGVPHEFGRVLVLGRARDFWGNCVVFANAFYRSVFPLAFEALLVGLPLLNGMRRNIHTGRFTLLDRNLLLFAAAVSVGSLAFQGYLWLPLLLHAPSLMILAATAPAAYLLLTAIHCRKVSRFVSDA